MSEIRYNTITGDWVIVAPKRSKRPSDFVKQTKQKIILPYSETCPFCRGNENASPDEEYRIPGEGDSWLVRSVRNKFSALSLSGEPVSYDESKKTITGVGRHEVIIETPVHNHYMPFHSRSEIFNILKTYRERFIEFYRDSRVKHVIIFKNHGQDAGTSLEHPHSQIVGLPVVPGQVKQRLDLAIKAYVESGKCIYCQTIQDEFEEKNRIVAESRHFGAFIPFASLSPCHIWIFPRVHSACFDTVTDEALDDLGSILLTLLGKLYSALGNPSFNLVIRSLSPQEGDVQFFHWYLAIVPRLSKAAGFELGTGMYINGSTPELSADMIRNASGVA